MGKFLEMCDVKEQKWEDDFPEADVLLNVYTKTKALDVVGIIHGMDGASMVHFYREGEETFIGAAFEREEDKWSFMNYAAALREGNA